METIIPFKKEIIKAIKEKKELQGLSDKFVEHILKKTIQQKIKLKKQKEELRFEQYKRGKEYKLLISETRKQLRTIYGVFVQEPLVNHIKQNNESLDPESAFVQTLLSQHQSTKERANFYKTFYKTIYEELEKKGLPEKYVLADFACGYNPLAYHFISHKPQHYDAIDLSPKDMEGLNIFFKENKIDGTAHAFDLLSEEFKKWAYKKTWDVVFLFKALDSLETIERHSSKKLIANIKAKYFVVTFPEQSIGGRKKINSSKRTWFETFCTKNNWDWTRTQLTNETIYIVIKNS